MTLPTIPDVGLHNLIQLATPLEEDRATATVNMYRKFDGPNKLSMVIEDLEHLQNALGSDSFAATG